MSSPLVECIPNFSDARRPEVIHAIREAIGSVPGIRVLDTHSDLDHNRSVITFAGPPQAVEAAAFEGIAKAAELIDLNRHRGEHPRIGAADVVPFVPISGVTLQDCVALAKRVGERVGRELGIPVYLYEAAATRPERQNLEDIRRGEFEALKAEIGVKPERQPDYGPNRVGPAGATVIGARTALVAYNIYLNTGDAEVAKKIAKAIRHSSGGLRHVKALGMLVDGQAQVSMNLTDFTKTPVGRVMEMVRREAARYGAAVTRSELVGLIPQAALVDAAQWYLQLDNLTPDQILENRLFGASAGEMPHPAAAPEGEGDFLDDLAAGTAAPGGGAAAAYAGAMAAALVSMVARLTVGRRKYAGVEPQMQAVLESAEKLRSELTAAAIEDAAAFREWMAAARLPKSSPEEIDARDEALEAATHHVTEVPLRVARAAVAALGLVTVAAQHGNRNAISDAGSAAHLARAALGGAALNVRANAGLAADREAAQAWLAEIARLETRGAESFAAIERVLRERPAGKS